MSDIIIGIIQLNDPDKSIGIALIEFYDSMKELEKDPARGGKQATAIVMAMNDIKKIMEAEIERRLKDQFNKDTH